MCVYVYACVYVCIYVCMCVCMYVYVCMYVCESVHMCMIFVTASCNILTFDRDVNQETGASDRRYRNATPHRKRAGVKQLYNQVPKTV